MTRNELETLAKDLATKYPQANVRLGYIGNCGVDRRGAFDDRSWYLFTDVRYKGERDTISIPVEPGVATTIRTLPDGSYIRRQLTPAERATLITRPLVASDLEAFFIEQLAKA